MSRRRKSQSKTERPSAQSAAHFTAVPSPKGRNWKRICFRFVAVVGMPALFFVLLEVCLRIIGYGYPTGFLLPSHHKGQEVYVQNNKFGWRFFGPKLSRNPNPLLITRKKSANTIRIFVFGESAAKGDPDPRFGLSRTLEATLSLRHPGTHFEVVNAGVTAINSHAILPIARDCARADGDIWVIYMGNNEVVGPFGAGTVFGSQSPPLPFIRSVLKIKTTRTGQLMDSLLSRRQSASAETPDWRGMEMFLDQQIRSDDPRMVGVYHHFERNLQDILRVGLRNDVGIVLSTVAVNLKDCAPFGSSHRPALTKTELSEWRTAFQEGVQAQATGALEDAVKHFGRAAKIDDSHAELYFRLGQCELALGRPEVAQQNFKSARDLDTLRFRCDSQLNDLVRNVASDQEFHQVLLAEAERAFAEHSADDLPGNEFFYEHVHLTFEGNCLLARILAEPIEQLLAERFSIQAEPNQSWPSSADCAARLGWSEISRYSSWKRIFPRLNRPPFIGQMDHELQLAQWRSNLTRLATSSRPAGIAASLKAVNTALASVPNDSELLFQLSQLKNASGDIPGAITSVRHALEQLPSDAEGWMQLGLLLARSRQFEVAAEAFQQAVLLDPWDVVSQDGLAQSYAAMGKNEDALRVLRRLLEQQPHLGVAWLHLGLVLEKLGEGKEAEACFEKAVINPGSNLSGLLELAGFCQGRGWFERAAILYVEALKQDPANAELHVGAGQNFAAVGRLAEALQHSSQAIALAPAFAEAHLLRGTILGKQRELIPARESFRLALKYNPDLVDARLNLAIALVSEDPAAALALFQEVLQRKPDNATALKYAKELRQRPSDRQNK